MMIEEKNIAIVRAYIEAVEKLDVEKAAAFIDPAIVQTEYPNKLYAKGQVRGAEQMMKDLPRAKTVLRSQTYPIVSIFGAGEMVTVETRWEGILNVPLGRLRPGDAMVAHICMIFTLKDGKIVIQKNYDCYEDFAAIAA